MCEETEAHIGYETLQDLVADERQRWDLNPGNLLLKLMLLAAIFLLSYRKSCKPVRSFKKLK